MFSRNRYSHPTQADVLHYCWKYCKSPRGTEVVAEIMKKLSHWYESEEYALGLEKISI